jgi:hypothetical protein
MDVKQSLFFEYSNLVDSKIQKYIFLESFIYHIQKFFLKN